MKRKAAHDSNVAKELYCTSNFRMYASLQYLVQVANLSSGVVEKLNNCIDIIRLSKGSFLIKQEQHCEHIYIIEDGFARIFSTIKDKEITTLFAKENDIITSTYSQKTAAMKVFSYWKILF